MSTALVNVIEAQMSANTASVVKARLIMEMTHECIALYRNWRADTGEGEDGKGLTDPSGLRGCQIYHENKKQRRKQDIRGP
jgi:hypothetical protein